MPVFYRKDMMPMSQFSELLKEYIKKKDITIKALAEKCGIDRTYLHKILKGERKVPSVDFVENISLQLMLSTEDKSRLMELYNISEMGGRCLQSPQAGVKDNTRYGKHQHGRS